MNLPGRRSHRSVSAGRHGDWCVDQVVNYEFARNVNFVPLMTVEMATAAREYTIVFGGTNEAVQPIVLLGVENNVNAYVAEDGSWGAHYIPAFVRRYPYVFSSTEKADAFTLCIDEGWSGCNQKGRGERLFDEQGKGTAYLEKMFGFVTEFQRQTQRTREFCQKLQTLNLLDGNALEFTLPNDQKRSLRGFMSVNLERLKALPAETLQELAQTDQLPLIYTHLQSMNNLSLMLERVVKRDAHRAAVTTAPA